MEFIIIFNNQKIIFMKNQLLFITILILLSVSCSHYKGISLVEDDRYPLWLKTDSSRTDQTSGIAFIQGDSLGKHFLLVDDIGSIHLITLSENSVDKIERVNFAPYFNEFPKLDFEEIVYDKSDGSVYLSIEGNGENSKILAGIYKLNFKDDNILSREIITVQKILFDPDSLFLKYLESNIAYEGLAIDQKYFYLGLENLFQNFQFVDSTVIFIASKSDFNIVKEINTKIFGITTICGLFSDSDLSLWGVDRNRRKIFHIMFDDYLNIQNYSEYDCSLQIPGYKNLNYLPSIESITFDDENNIYTVDDPWREMFVPPHQVLEKLDNETINNFKSYIPTIFKYKINYPEGEK